MRITELAAFHVRIELRKPIRHASHARSDTDSIVVRCRLADGTIGWGEGLPREYVTGETIDSAWSLLQEVDLAAQLGGDIAGLREAIPRLQMFQLPRPRDDGRECFGNSVRCAIELSVLDAVCRTEGVPLSIVTELVPETIAIRERRERVRYSAAFTAMSRVSQISRAIKLRLFGLHQAKVKTGVQDVDDVALLRRLRWWLGDSFDLRIDANEAWSCQNLTAKLEPLLPFGITSVEQPVPHEQVDGLASLRGRIGVPLMLDESLCSLVDARRAIERGTCDLFNIRLSKCGGFLNSLRLAALAHQAGLGYQLGCQVGETGILSAAGRHFGREHPLPRRELRSVPSSGAADHRGSHVRFWGLGSCPGRSGAWNSPRRISTPSGDQARGAVRNQVVRRISLRGCACTTSENFGSDRVVPTGCRVTEALF